MIYRLERDDAAKGWRISYTHLDQPIATLKGPQAELAAATYARHLSHHGDAVADVFLTGLVAGLSVGEANVTFGSARAEPTLVERARNTGVL